MAATKLTITVECSGLAPDKSVICKPRPMVSVSLSDFLCLFLLFNNLMPGINTDQCADKHYDGTVLMPFHSIHPIHLFSFIVSNLIITVIVHNVQQNSYGNLSDLFFKYQMIALTTALQCVMVYLYI